MPLVLIGAATDDRREQALQVFEAEGWVRAGRLSPWPGADAVLAAPSAATLRAADAQGIRYVLVHHGQDDGEPEGTYERAHHRVEAAELPELARRLRRRQRMLVSCLAFGFKGGVPDGCAWVIDARFLDNPYWVPDLKPLTGRHPEVREYVLRQPAAQRMLDSLEALLVPLLPEYARRGRMEMTIAVGCTGGRHRSVVLADELATRLRGAADVDVESRARELDA